VNRLPTDLGDDVDLDALMIRVREAAMASGTSGGAARPQTPGDAKGADIDLARVIDAQGEWNEHTGQSLAALVECLRTLRDDWTDAHARLREEMDHLSALVAELRSRTDTPVTRANQLADTSTRARGASASPRTNGKGRSINARRRRS
jgi:hypothetical protein